MAAASRNWCWPVGEAQAGIDVKQLRAVLEGALLRSIADAHLQAFGANAPTAIGWIHKKQEQPSELHPTSSSTPQSLCSLARETCAHPRSGIEEVAAQQQCIQGSHAEASCLDSGASGSTPPPGPMGSQLGVSCGSEKVDVCMPPADIDATAREGGSTSQPSQLVGDQLS